MSYILTRFTFLYLDNPKILHICQPGGYETSAGYIITPGQGINDCSCILTPTAGRGSYTTISILDFKLHKNAGANEMCHAMIQIGDDTYCRNNSIIYSPVSQVVSVKKMHDSPILLRVHYSVNNYGRFVFHFNCKCFVLFTY